MAKAILRSVGGNERSSEVREPAAPYYVGGGGSAIAEREPWKSDLDDDGIDWDTIGAPESITVRSYEELCQKLEEGKIAEMEGRVRPIDDWWRDFKRRVANGEL